MKIIYKNTRDFIEIKQIDEITMFHQDKEMIKDSIFELLDLAYTLSKNGGFDLREFINEYLD